MAKIFDTTRKKYVEATPEEVVRQWFIKFLESLGYPVANISTEQQLQLAGKLFRADIVVYHDGKPVMLVECKAPNVKLSRETLEQIWKYNYVLGAKFLVLTNGKNILFCKTVENDCEFLNKFLTWRELLDELG